MGTGVWGTGGMGRVWATWVMGHMGNGAHGPMGDWHIFVHSIIITGWILTKILLDIDINIVYLNTLRFFPRWLHLSHIFDGF